MRLKLGSGRTIHLVRLQQHRTYEGLLCGYPHSRMNASIIERLPEVASIGIFDSGALKRPDSEPYSSMTLAWFQQDFGPPVADPVRSQIEALDWEALAKDWCW